MPHLFEMVSCVTACHELENAMAEQGEEGVEAGDGLTQSP